MVLRNPSLLLLLVLASPLLVRAQESSDRQSAAYRASVAQETLRKDTAAVQAQLAEVAEAMRQLLPNDVAAVDRALQQMQNLSQGEMETAIAALRDASQSSDRSAQLSKLADAMKNQAKISVTLKELAVDLDARQSLDSIATELSTLLRRQVAAQTEVAQLGRVQPRPEDLRNDHRRSYDAVNDDQKLITQDVIALTKRLDDLTTNLPEESRPRLVRATEVAREHKLVEAEQNAARLTTEGPLPSAAEAQNDCATTLVLMEQAFAADGNPLGRLGALSDELKKAVTQQEEITTKIAAIGERKSVPDDLKRQAAALGEEVAALRAELQPLNGNAAAALQKAQDKIEQAQLNYKRMWEERVDAAANTRAALEQMQAASQALDQQAAQAAAAAAQNPDQLANTLDALRRETEQARDTQARVQPGAAPPFGMTPEQAQALQHKVSDLQQRALPIAPPAAQALGEAAAEMAQPSAKMQQAAAASLGKAAEMLRQQEDAVAGRTPAQQALERVENTIAQAAQTIAKAKEEMKTAAGMSEAFKNAGAAQQQIQAAEQAAAQAEAPNETKTQLAQAAQGLAQAQQGTAQGDAAKAKAGAEAASQALAQAQSAAGAAKQEMAQQAGAPMASKAGNNEGQRQNDGGVEEGSGNGGGGKTGDFLAGGGAAGVAQVVGGLPPHDREAISQLQNEKTPAEFRAEVQQYYKNIADGVSP